MTADLINFRRERKRRARAADSLAAAANRTAFGTPRSLKAAAEAERQRAAQHLEGHRRPTEGDAPETA